MEGSLLPWLPHSALVHVLRGHKQSMIRCMQSLRFTDPPLLCSSGAPEGCWKEVLLKAFWG